MLHRLRARVDRDYVGVLKKTIAASAYHAHVGTGFWGVLTTSFRAAWSRNKFMAKQKDDIADLSEVLAADGKHPLDHDTLYCLHHDNVEAANIQGLRDHSNEAAISRGTTYFILLMNQLIRGEQIRAEHPGLIEGGQIEKQAEGADPTRVSCFDVKLLTSVVLDAAEFLPTEEELEEAATAVIDRARRNLELPPGEAAKFYKPAKFHRSRSVPTCSTVADHPCADHNFNSTANATGIAKMLLDRVVPQLQSLGMRRAGSVPEHREEDLKYCTEGEWILYLDEPAILAVATTTCSTDGKPAWMDIKYLRELAKQLDLFLTVVCRYLPGDDGEPRVFRVPLVRVLCGKWHLDKNTLTLLGKLFGPTHLAHLFGVVRKSAAAISRVVENIADPTEINNEGAIYLKIFVEELVQRHLAAQEEKLVVLGRLVGEAEEKLQAATLGLHALEHGEEEGDAVREQLSILLAVMGSATEAAAGAKADMAALQLEAPFNTAAELPMERVFDHHLPRVLACPQAQVQLLHFVALSTRYEYFCSAEWGDLARALRLCKVIGFLPAIANSVQYLGLQAEEFAKRRTESSAYLTLSDAYLEVVATGEQTGKNMISDRGTERHVNGLRESVPQNGGGDDVYVAAHVNLKSGCGGTCCPRYDPHRIPEPLPTDFEEKPSSRRTRKDPQLAFGMGGALRETNVWGAVGTDISVGKYTLSPRKRVPNIGKRSMYSEDTSVTLDDQEMSHNLRTVVPVGRDITKSYFRVHHMGLPKRGGDPEPKAVTVRLTTTRAKESARLEWDRLYSLNPEHINNGQMVATGGGRRIYMTDSETPRGRGTRTFGNDALIKALRQAAGLYPEIDIPTGAALHGKGRRYWAEKLAFYRKLPGFFNAGRADTESEAGDATEGAAEDTEVGWTPPPRPTAIDGVYRKADKLDSVSDLPDLVQALFNRTTRTVVRWQNAVRQNDDDAGLDGAADGAGQAESLYNCSFSSFSSISGYRQQ